jgi:S1-C subfamily serine protease
MEHARPLSAAQTSVLHDVVTHVFLTGEPYEKGTTGFLGMKMQQYYRFGNNEQPEEFGITVESRFPGFGAYRSLLDGDVILSIVEMPQAVLRIPKDFSDAVSPLSPGTQINLIVLRQARQMKIPVTLDARPAQLSALVDPGTVEAFNANRVAKAEEYWKQEFGALVDTSVSQAR